MSRRKRRAMTLDEFLDLTEEEFIAKVSLEEQAALKPWVPIAVPTRPKPLGIRVIGEDEP